MESLGTIGVFLFFGFTSAVGLIYASCVTRNSSYKYVEVEYAESDITKVQDSSSFSLAKNIIKKK
jgi:hypothetical protein